MRLRRDTIYLAELLTVLVGIAVGEHDDLSAHGCLLVIGGDIRGVFRDEDVGRDATTTIDGTAIGGVILLALVLDAVAREELAVLVACKDVFLVVFVLACCVGLLDAAS